MRSEDRMNRFVKTRGSNFGNDNANTNPVTLKSGGSSKLKRSSDFPSRIKSNELVTCQVGIISGDKKRQSSSHYARHQITNKNSKKCNMLGSS